MKEIIKKLLQPTGYTLAKINPEVNPQHERQVSAEQWFELFFKTTQKDDFFFVQIGANDGSQGEFLNQYVKQYNLSGILVEPQADVFAKLKASYQDVPNLQFANVAIADTTGKLPFYTVKKSLHTEENYFDVTAISTFDRETFKKTVMKRVPHRIADCGPNIDDYAEVVEIPSLRFDDFIAQYQIDHIDYLQIDCEGYDFEIIKLIEFDSLRPQVINFESKWLSDEDRSACESLLEGKGYSIFRHGNDTCAFLVK